MTGNLKAYLILLILIFSMTHAGSIMAQSRAQREAMNYFMKGGMMEDWNEQTYAYTYYKAALDKCADCDLVKLALLRVSITLGKFDKAKKLATQLIEKGNYKTDASIYLGEANYRIGELEKSAENFESVVDDLDEQRKMKVLKFLSRIYYELNDTSSAAKALERVERIDSTDVFVNYRLGLIYANNGKVEEAKERFEAVLKSDPAFGDLAIVLSSIYIQEGKREKAKEVLSSAFRSDPDSKEVRKRLFEMLIEDSDFELGISVLEPLFQKDRIDQELLAYLGRFYYESDMPADALKVYKRILDSSGPSPALLRIIADIEMDLGNNKNALENLQMLIEKEPDKFTNYSGLLLLSHDLAGKPSSQGQQADISEADSARYLEKALELVDKDSAGQNYLVGVVLNEAQDMERALDFLVTAEKLRPQDRRIVLELARTYEEMGRIEEALTRIERLYQNDADDPTVNNYYGYLLALSGERLDFAEDLLSKALKADPGNGYYLDSLGWIKYKKGEYRKALEILADASNIVGDDPTIWEHIGDTHLKMGDIGAAEEAYRISIELNPGSAELMEKLREISEREPDKTFTDR